VPQGTKLVEPKGKVKVPYARNEQVPELVSVLGRWPKP